MGVGHAEVFFTVLQGQARSSRPPLRFSTCPGIILCHCKLSLRIFLKEIDSSSSDSIALVSLGRQRVLQPLIANVTWLTKERKFDTIRVFACLNYWLDTKLFVRTHHKIPISTVQTCILDLGLILFSPLYSLSLSLFTVIFQENLLNW